MPEEPSAVQDVLSFLEGIREDAEAVKAGQKDPGEIDFDWMEDRAEDLHDRLKYVWDGVL